VESFLERERAQLPLWLVAGFGAGITSWFALDGPREWLAIICIGAGLALAAFSFEGGRLERAIGWLGLSLAIGCGLIWLRSEWVAAPRLDRPVVTTFEAKIEQVETMAAKGDLRLSLATTDPAPPPLVRVSMKADSAPAGISTGATLRVRARLAPPPPMALPGTHDFARDAWFREIGAVGRALGERRYRCGANGPSSVGTDGEIKIRYAARPCKGETVNASVCDRARYARCRFARA
jgi:competence protein ComEC